MNRRVMIYVQHLLGIGHLKRMSLLADGLAGAGAKVLLVTGGMPAPHVMPRGAVEVLQLPPLRTADENFSGLIDAEGNPADDATRQRRKALLTEAVTTFAPDILVVELFPLGRRQMRFELVPLLDAARPVCQRIACSVRDIVNRRPHREEEALGWLNRWFDILLVHGDEMLTPIRDSVPTIGTFTGRVIHTGYLGDAPIAAAERGSEILVSAGGGASGEKLFRAAAGASALLAGDHGWRIRHGRDADTSTIGELRRAAGPDCIIEPVASDFRQRLARAALSVSQFGYNTAMDIVQTATPAIVAPFEGGGETEQLRRAEAFAGQGIRLLRESELSAPGLAAAVAEMLSDTAPSRRPIDVNGLDRSVRTLLQA